MHKTFYSLIVLLSFSFLEARYYSIGANMRPNIKGPNGTVALGSENIMNVNYWSDGETYFSVVLAGGHGQHAFSVANAVISYYQYLLKASLKGIVVHPEFQSFTKENVDYSYCHKILLDKVNRYLQFFYAENSVNPVSQLEQSGTTLNGFVLDSDNAYVFNIGDSRTVIIRGKELLFSTHDHTVITTKDDTGDDNKVPSYTLSRSFGDLAAHKEGLLSSDVDTTTVKIEEGDFIITASHGFWKVFSSEDVLALLNESVAKNYKSGMTYRYLCRLVAEEFVAAARDKGSQDNLSVIVTYVSEDENH